MTLLDKSALPCDLPVEVQAMDASSKILVATDLSESADEAIRQGDERAKAAGAHLVVCHVVPNALRHNPLFPQRAQAETALLLDAETRAAGAVRERVIELTGRDPKDFRVLVENGTPEAAIVRAADDVHADLVVVASRGSTGLDRLLLGSVASRVVRYAHCPVLVARPSPKSGRILAATDFSDEAYHAVSAAAVEAAARKAKVTLLHSVDVFPNPAMGFGGPFGASWVVPPPDLVEEVRSASTKALIDLLEQFKLQGEVLATEGDAATAILQQARELPAEIIVLATRGRTGLSRMVLGSVAEKVVAVAPCSVLAVRR